MLDCSTSACWRRKTGDLNPSTWSLGATGLEEKQPILPHVRVVQTKNWFDKGSHEFLKAHGSPGKCLIPCCTWLQHHSQSSQWHLPYHPHMSHNTELSPAQGNESSCAKGTRIPSSQLRVRSALLLHYLLSTLGMTTKACVSISFPIHPVYHHALSHTETWRVNMSR